MVSLQAQEAASAAYNDALQHMKKGQQLFRQAMENTSGGQPRADLCGQARKEYFEATLSAEEYRKLTGQGDDLLQSIQMGDYEAMKNAPQGTWSPPARDEAPAAAAPAGSAPAEDGGATGLILFIGIGVLGAAGFVIYRTQAANRRARSGSGRHSSRRAAVQEEEAPPARTSSRRAAAAPPASRTSSRRQAAAPPQPAPRSASRRAPAQPEPRATSSRRAAAQPPPSGRMRRR
jgi:hypothetical protein